MIHCANCGTNNRDDTKYCKNCGHALVPVSYVACAKCNAQNPASSLFCNRCGERLVKAKATARTPNTPKASIPPPDWAMRQDASKPAEQEVPDWFTRFFGTAPSQKQLIPTHELLRMANALGVDVDYSTLRFWQKRGLVSKPVRGPVSSGRGTRGYYDPSLIDRLSFIREIQKHHALGLESIREELAQIDKQLAQSTATPAAQLYRERITALQTLRDAESKRTLVAVLSKAMGIDPSEISAVSIEKNNGEIIRLIAELAISDRNRKS